MSEIGKIDIICDSCGSKMKKQLSAPTLIGFDDVGRSISKKDKNQGSSKESTPKKDAAQTSYLVYVYHDPNMDLATIMENSYNYPLNLNCLEQLRVPIVYYLMERVDQKYCNEFC